MSSDLGLDPSDPLNLMLHNSLQNSDDSSMEDSSCEGASPPDWSQISSLWSENDLGQTKSFPDIMDFTDHSSLPMDMNFNPNMSIEPSALHFDPTKFNIYPYDLHSPPYSNDLFAPQFPFTFQSPYSTSLSSSDSSPQLSTQGRRRLSITSSSSSSGASLSSVSDSNSAPEIALPAYPADHADNATEDQPPMHTDDPMAELAERVRQSAGVMLALPMAAHLQAQMNNQAVSPGVSGFLLIILNLPNSQSSHQQPYNHTQTPYPSSSTTRISIRQIFLDSILRSFYTASIYTLPST
jgi:hypothetical protein